MSNCEALFCHLCKALSGGGAWGRAELDSGGAAARHLTTCHKVLFTSSNELHAKYNHTSVSFPGTSVAGRSYRPCTSGFSMVVPSWRSGFLALEELVQDLRWTEEQPHTGQRALGQATWILSSHLAWTHFWCLTSVEKALSHFRSVLPIFHI